MTSNDVLQAVIQRIIEHREGPRWGNATYLARTLAEAGLLADALPPEPLPDQQVRLDPDGWAWQKLTTYNGVDSWRTAGPPAWPNKDKDVRDWPVLVPEAQLEQARIDRDEAVRIADELRAERDRLADAAAEGVAARVSETVAVDAYALGEVAEKARAQWVNNFDDKRRLSDAVAEAIREHLPAATCEATPEGHITLDLRAISAETLRRQVEANPPYSILHIAARTELDRRAKAGEL